MVALLVTVRLPVRVPEAVGRKLTLTVHEAPAAIDVPQVLVCEKSPEVETPETDAAAVPVLCTVTVCALLVVLSAWLAKRQRGRAGRQRRGRTAATAAAREDLEVRQLSRRSSRCWR